MDLASCKFVDCVGNIGVDHVRKASAIPKAPHHLALVAECGVCQRPGQYVVERSVWDEAKAEYERAVSVPSPVESAVRAAKLELDFVDNVGELVALWRSFGPPLIEEHRDKCSCLDCWRRWYV